MKVLLYNHGSSYNHGCEAIIRTVADLINTRFPDANFTVSSLRPHEDMEYIENDAGRFRFINSDSLNRLTFERRRLIVGSLATVFHDIPVFPKLFAETVEAARESDVMISVGGDTFSYGKSAEMSTVSRKLRKYCDRSILWGCSIDAKYLEGDKFRYKVDVLKGFSLITARESMTFDTLKKLGFTNCEMYPDPAFILGAKEPAEPLFDNDHDIVGLNLSPLIIGYETVPGGTVKSYATLIKDLLDRTDFNIALISHVTCKTSDDTDASRAIMEITGGSDRIKIFNHGNAEEIKGVISKCRFFVAARTHASIAAYSQRIPTLVLGYSVKSLGIAKDIFGTSDGYVVPVQSLNGGSTLSEAFFGNIVKKEEAIRARYDEVMPEYFELTRASADAFERIVGKDAKDTR